MQGEKGSFISHEQGIQSWVGDPELTWQNLQPPQRSQLPCKQVTWASWDNFRGDPNENPRERSQITRASHVRAWARTNVLLEENRVTGVADGRDSGVTEDVWPHVEWKFSWNFGPFSWPIITHLRGKEENRAYTLQENFHWHQEGWRSDSPYRDPLARNYEV